MSKIRLELPSGYRIGSILGILVGLLPVTSYASPIAIAVIAMTFGWRLVPRRELLAAFAVSQYCLIQYIMILVHDDRAPFELELQRVYLIFIGLPFPIVLLLNSPAFDAASFRKWLPIGLMGSMCLLGLDFAVSQLTGNECRVSVAAFNPLAPPFLLVPLVLYSTFDGISRRSETKLDFLILTGVVLTIGAFGGARMAFYTSLFVSGVLTLYVFATGRRRISVKILGSLAVGVALVAIIDILSGCNFLLRIGSQVDTFTSGQTKDSSMAIRLIAWQNAIRHISGYGPEWLYGLGMPAELQVASEANAPLRHSHNQFLSWLIWSGLPGLLSGIALFGALPLLALRSLPLAAFIMAIGCGFLTDSLLKSPEVLASLSIIILVLHSCGQRVRPTPSEVT